MQHAAAGLDNVVFVPMQPRERLSEVLAAADIHTILLRHGLARSSVPSKMYSILAAGRPVVASVDPDTEVTRVLGNISGSGNPWSLNQNDRMKWAEGLEVGRPAAPGWSGGSRPPPWPRPTRSCSFG